MIDVDPRNEGDESIRELTERLGKLPPGPVAKTGGGGWHIFAQYPGRPVKKPSGSVPGIDIKATAGTWWGQGRSTPADRRTPGTSPRRRPRCRATGNMAFLAEYAPPRQSASCNREDRENREHGEHGEDGEDGG